MSTTSKQALAMLALFIGAQASAWADGPIYLCTDKAGRKELTDKERRGCRPLDLPGLIPAPRQAASTPRARPRAPVVAPASFPRVDTHEQRARDDERLGILQEELRAEEEELAGLRAEYKNGEPDRLGNERNYAKYQERVANLRDAIARSEKNIEALKREIASIR